MRLSEALQINQQPLTPGAPARKIHLVSGLTPLHLETMVKAYARRRFPGDSVEVVCGLFGDFEGNLRRIAAEEAGGALVVVEWSDLDARLGMRASAGWGEAATADILQQAPQTLRRWIAALSEAARAMPVALLGPTLPLPPITHFPPAQANPLELQLRCAWAGFLNQAAALRGVRLASDSALDLRSPHAARYDARMDLHAGFPYSVAHAAAVAELGFQCLFPEAPKKGLITDLDETLWKGIVGDAGVENVSWSLEGHAQPHALYQQLLASLAEAGTLIGIASKNDPATVREALARSDMLLKPSHIFPVEVSWGAKSEAVARILKAWNIGADAVVFVDDSPMELAEVNEKFPAMECVRFPSADPAGVVELLARLRRAFGKSEVREEDRLRLGSLRAAAEIGEAEAGGAASPDFLSRLNAQVTIEYSSSPEDGRAFELLNKTNQFNLNGVRYSENDWRGYFRQPGAFLAAVSYQDRFGPLGKIAVLGGRSQGPAVHVDFWVMSCRAFSRQIEFQLLRRLFDRFGAAEFHFAFQSTPRNGPLADFFRTFFPDFTGEPLTLTRERFDAACPELFHRVSETTHDGH